MYEVIVLGATFAAAGIARQVKGKCLVVEQRLQAGYEFFSALCCSRYEKTPETEEARLLQQKLSQKNAGIFGGERYIYPCFEEATVLFGTQTVSVERSGSGFVCHTHGVGGHASYAAKMLIDTRANGVCRCSKTYNFLMESRETPRFQGVHCEKVGADAHYVVRCPVSLPCGYAQARQAAWEIINRFSETQRLILLADAFDYQVKAGYPKTEGGILYLPSKAYEDPVLAFEAGLRIGEGMRT